MERIPTGFLKQIIWPLPAMSNRLQENTMLMSGMGIIVLGGLHELSQPPPFQETQQSIVASSLSFGESAKRAGWKHFEFSVDPHELAPALGDPALIVLDLRNTANFAAGHIPTARSLPFLEDLSIHHNPTTLIEKLRACGIDKNSHIILVAHNLEAYHLWWILEMGHKYPYSRWRLARMEKSNASARSWSCKERKKGNITPSPRARRPHWRYHTFGYSYRTPS